MAKVPEKKKKVKRPTAEKRVLQSEKKRLRNRSYRASVSTGIRSFESALKNGDAAEIQQSLNAVYSLFDKAAKRGVFKQNKADRSKARFTARAQKACA
jgi:small subunit ribosomal protein S20